MHQGKKNSISLAYFALSTLLISTLLMGCAETQVTGGRVDHTRLQDGTYEGSYRGGPNSVLVQVTIKNSNIVHIKILQHLAWRGGIAEAPIVARIIASQSTRVDAVSGATNSSRVIMNAVQDAIEKAYKQ
jgi:uncharacterized protein with FMN-binding domain